MGEYLVACYEAIEAFYKASTPFSVKYKKLEAFRRIAGYTGYQDYLKSFLERLDKSRWS